MSHQQHACQRYVHIELARAEGIALTAEDQAFSAQHLESCASCRLEQAALDVLATDSPSGLGQPLDDLARRRLVDQVLSQAATSPEESDRFHAVLAPQLSDSRARRLFLPLTFVAGAAAASVLLFFLWRNETIPEPAAPGLSDHYTARDQAPGAGRFLLLAGQVQLERKKAELRRGIQAGESLTTSAGRAIFLLERQVIVSVGAESQLRWQAGAQGGLSLRLVRGAIMVVVPPRRGLQVSVQTTHGALRVKGTVFMVRASSKEASVLLLRGGVEMEERDGRHHLLEAGYGMRWGDPDHWPLSTAERTILEEGFAAIILSTATSSRDHASRTLGSSATPREKTTDQPTPRLVPAGEQSYPTKDPSGNADKLHPRPIPELPNAASKETPVELLRQAQRLRHTGQWTEAARTFQHIIETFPHSGEARVSLVSSGKIQLEKLHRPTQAIRLFDRYLSRSPDGPLAQEALLGQAKAWRALGRKKEEHAALQLFLRQFPQALQAQEVKQRLEALGPLAH